MYVCGVLAVLSLTVGCTSIDMSTYEDDYIYAELAMDDPRQITLTIDNQGPDELILDQTKVRYIRYNQESPLTPVTETEHGADVPPLRIAPQTQGSRNFALEPSLSVTNGKRTINKWVPEDTSALGFKFYYRLEGKEPAGEAPAGEEREGEAPGREERPLFFPDPHERELVGKVKVTLGIGMPFFYTIPERRQRIYDQAVAQARAAFGAGGRELRLVNLHYDSKISGFVENAILTADVIAVEEK
jgi:hypothetical protein